VNLQVFEDSEALAAAAAGVWLERLEGRQELVVAVPAGRTPRPTYRRLREEAGRRRLSFRHSRVFPVDELIASAPAEGYFWRQVRAGFLDWAGVPPVQCHPFDPAAPDPAAMCERMEARIAEVGGLDLVLLGLGLNGHLAANEPGSAFDSRTRPVVLQPETVAYIRADADVGSAVGDRAVTLGLGTIAEAREALVLVTGAAKRDILRRALTGPVGPDCPASIAQRLPAMRVLADRAAASGL
jgi:glucosamine-6-phosphate deaminase